MFRLDLDTVQIPSYTPRHGLASGIQNGWNIVIDQLFEAGNMLALVSWGLLIFLPRWRGVAQAMATIVAPALLSVAYSALIGVWWSRGQGGFGSLSEVHALFQTPGALLAGWLHYLAFDLLVGARIARQSRSEGVPHVVVIPILILTFLFGPMGYLASLIVRAARRMAVTGPESVRVVRAVTGFLGREPRLMASALGCFAVMVPLAVAAMIDDRTLGGVNVWLKPLKFLVSTGLYLATLGFFLPMAGEAFRRSALGRFVVWGALATTLFEVVYITWRASRGEASHFNKSTPLAGALYGLMGLAALALAATGPVLAWGIARSSDRRTNPTHRLAVVLGLILTFVLGATGGVVMSAGPGHFVGPAPADGSILPWLGWSRTVGDLRVPHFMGLHAQQVVPLAGLLVAGFRRGRMLVIAFAGVYSIIVIGLFVQALAGHPVLPG